MFELVQLIIEMSKEDSSIESVISNLLWFSYLPIVLMTALVFYFRRSQLLSLFGDWNNFEISIHFQKDNHYKILIKFIYSSYSLIFVSLLMSVVVIMWSQPGASYLLSHYQILRDSLTFPGVATFHLATVVVSSIFLSLSDLVPAWTFYHAGLALQSFIGEIEKLIIVDKTRPITLQECVGIRHIQERYEVLSRLIDRANKMFGPWIVFEKAWAFFMISALLYIVLSKIKDPDWTMMIAYAIILLMYSFRFATCTLMAAHVYKCARRLRVVLSIALSQEVMNAEETNRASQFLRRMRENPLAARPLNLYNITPSLLFTFYSFAISYVVILLRIQ